METSSFYYTTPTPFSKIVAQEVPKPSRVPSSGLRSRRLTPGISTKLQRFGDAVATAKCTASDSGFSVEFKDEEEEEWMKMGRLREKCKERKGMVELLECLEREAIQGEDQGREASDYNRRAQIFDKSSRVFQALKEGTEEATTQSQNS